MAVDVMGGYLDYTKTNSSNGVTELNNLDEANNQEINSESILLEIYKVKDININNYKNKYKNLLSLYTKRKLLNDEMINQINKVKTKLTKIENKYLVYGIIIAVLLLVIFSGGLIFSYVSLILEVALPINLAFVVIIDAIVRLICFGCFERPYGLPAVLALISSLPFVSGLETLSEKKTEKYNNKISLLEKEKISNQKELEYINKLMNNIIKNTYDNDKLLCDLEATINNGIVVDNKLILDELNNINHKLSNEESSKSIEDKKEELSRELYQVVDSRKVFINNKNNSNQKRLKK